MFENIATFGSTYSIRKFLHVLVILVFQSCYFNVFFLLYAIGTDIWLEVYCTSDKAWISIDCIHGHVKRPELCESHATKPITYVVAFDNGESS